MLLLLAVLVAFSGFNSSSGAFVVVVLIFSQVVLVCAGGFGPPAWTTGIEILGTTTFYG